jgi:hypothetical protein
LCPSTLFNIEKKLNGGSSKMGIKRRIISSGRKFITKHKAFYDKAMATREAAGDEHVWVDTVTLEDKADGTFDLTVTTEGDWEVADKVGYSIDGAAVVKLAANVLTAAAIAAADGEHTVEVTVYRSGTTAVAKSSKTATVVVSGN